MRNWRVSLDTVENYYPIITNVPRILGDNLTRAEVKAIRRHWNKKLTYMYEHNQLPEMIDIIVVVERHRPLVYTDKGMCGGWEDMTAEWCWQEMNYDIYK